MSVYAKPPEYVRGVYLAPHTYSERKVVETIHYARLSGLNAVVLHVKDPFGHLHWGSKNPIALEIGAVKDDGRLAAALKRFKESGIWTIAKTDLFQDSLLADSHPEMAILDTQTGKPWRNKNALSWTNPYDRRVWDYNIALAKELAALGFDEIQFDYIRFPSDGNLSRIRCPEVVDGKTKIETIGAFLKAANAELKPLGIILSVDLFGFVAWKSDDFGVGQRIEEIAPHVDAICPMLYPSHFPSGFLGKKNPADFPKEIMELSVEKLSKRTTVEVRPWVQAFWYTPDDIIAQIEGIESKGGKNWLIWNPASDYELAYQAFAKRLKQTFPEPKMYPGIEELELGGPREIRGLERVVHLTDYAKGRTMLCLEGPKGGETSPYGTPAAVLGALDGAVMDRILQTRGVQVSKETHKAKKVQFLTGLLCQDLSVSVYRMRPEPFYIDWKGDCRFSR